MKCKLYYYLWKAADADTKMARAITDLMSALGSRSGSRMRSLRWTNKRDFYILNYLALDRILKIKMTQRTCSLDQLKKLAWKFFKIIKDKSTLSLFLENMFTKNNDIEKCTFLCRFFIWKIWVWRTNLLQSISIKSERAILRDNMGSYLISHRYLISFYLNNTAPEMMFKDTSWHLFNLSFIRNYIIFIFEN